LGYGPYIRVLYANWSFLENRIILLSDIADNKLLAYKAGHSAYHVRNMPENITAWCTANDRFRLLEYQELQEARESAATAKKHALIAICISIASLLASICFSIYQVATPVTLDQKVLAIQEKQLAATEKIVQLLQTQEPKE